MRDQLPAIQKCEDLVKDLLPRVEKRGGPQSLDRGWGGEVLDPQSSAS